MGMGSLMEILQNYQHDYLRSLELSRESIEVANKGRLEGEHLIIRRPRDLVLGDVCVVYTSTATIDDTLIFTQSIVCPRGTITVFWHHVMRGENGDKIPFVCPVG